MSTGFRRVGALDSVFLYAETPSTMMHVASLLRFAPIPDAHERLRRLIEDTRRESVVYSPWNRKLRHPAALTTPLQGWVVDEHLDLDYHLRRSALPTPGDERELGVLISRLHSNPLDLSRPPWEMHVIEGLEDGGFAVYIKVHHALVDGYTGTKLIARGLSTGPDDRSTPPMFAVPPEPRARRESEPRSLLNEAVDRLKGVAKGVGAGATAAYQLGSALGNHVVHRGDGEALVGPGQAPETILNRRIGRNRRFATQQLSLPLVKAAGKACGATVNDVCLAVLGGGLRRFLAEAGELPERPLIAFVPVNVRPKDDPGGGNAVGAILATMGTDIADPVERLRAVAASTRAAKEQLEGMSQAAMIGYAAAILSPLGAQAGLAYTGLPSPVGLTFNVIVSNVPGPKEDRYFRGSRLQAMHPVSIPIHGAGLNVTMMSYVDTLNFGFVGDRDAVPHLQRLAVYVGDDFAELRTAAGV
jgi:diacylglycerol O-acyltransferase / wax synthase